jgi:O-antigen/teichoic acid export membrane protein
MIVVMFLEAATRYWYLRRFVVKWFIDKSVKLGNMRMFHPDLFHSIWKTTWNTGLTFVALYIIGYIDALIVGQFNDSTSINRFFITKRIFGFVKGFSNAPFYANVQRIYSLGAAKDFPELKKKAAVYIFYSMLLIVGFFVGIGLFGNWLLSFFTETRLVPMTLYIIMALTVILDFHSSFHADIYVSTNHFPFLIPAGITGLIIGAIGIPVANMYGIFGLVVVPFVASMIVNNWYPVYLSFKLTGWNMASYIKDLFIYG